MPKLPAVRRRRTTKRQKAAHVAETAIAALPAIRLARKGWSAARVARFGPVAGVVLALVALRRRRRARKAGATAPWDTSAVPARPHAVPHGDKLADAAPSPAAASLNGTSDHAKPDPQAPSRDSLADPPSTPAA